VPASDTTMMGNQSFARLFQASPAPFLVLKPDAPRFTIIEVNEAYLAATMRTREDVVGLGIFEAYPDNPDDPAIAGVRTLRASIEHVLASKQPDTLPGLKYDVSRPDGTFEERWWSPVNSPVLDENGEVEAIIHNANDVTEQYRAEKALRENEARLRFMNELDEALRSSGDAVAAMSAAAQLLGRRLGASRTAYAAVDVDSDAFIIHRDYTAPGIASSAGTYSLDLFGPRAAVDMRGGQTLVIRDVAGELALGEGRETFQSIGIDAIVCCPLVSGGRLAAMMAVHQDTPRDWRGDEISLVEAVVERCWAHVERVSAESRLRESEAKYHAVANSVDQMIWLTRPDGFHDYYNDRWYEFTGAPYGSTDGEAWNGLFHPDDQERSWALWQHCLKTGEPYHIEYRLRHRSGQYRWVIGRAQCVRDQNGQIARWYGSCTDIHDLKMAEEQLRELNETLEQRVFERTAELEQAHEALRQSQKMEAVGQLTGGIAHDFNNLLAGISGSLDMMQTRLQQGRVGDLDRYMVGAQGAAKRASALTHRLLAFSRRQTLDPKPTDVNRLVAGMEDLIRRTVGPQIAVETVAKAGLWSALVDPNQLENALLNLCINARDAMPNGGSITIETANRWLDDRAARERDLPPGQYLSMCVSDNGTGMSPDIIERAFDPFFTTKPIGVGTGLGLSMIYGFARQSGGQVRIYSEVGNGTMVCVYLPRHHEEEVCEPEVVPTLPRVDSRGKTVLVVDDEPLVRMLVVDAVEDLGFSTIEAGDGPQALKVLRSDAFVDLLITDVGLPNGMNGRQVADAARELRANLKVLFVTGYAENAVLSHGHLDPGMQVVTKPFDMTVLSNRIQGMFDD
jgi:PAS domain S-box-containing protein